MERTVPRPRTDSQEIELYLRTIYSLLRSTAAVHIRSLEEAHASMNSSLHPQARAGAPAGGAPSLMGGTHWLRSSLRAPISRTSCPP